MLEPTSSWPIRELAIALGIGLLIGTERERSKGSGPGRGAAGVRTFSLVTLLGAVAAAMGSVTLIAVLGAAVVLLAGASYLRTRQADPGLTTEVALILAFALGVLSISAAGLAAGLGVLVALLLASRTRLHDFVSNRLSDQENRAIDPYGILNPQVIWRLTVLVLLLNAFGYLALRSLGVQRGLAIAGFFGGFVSSAATIGTYGARLKAHPALFRPAIAGAALSSIATVLELAAILAVANYALLQRLSLAFVFMGLAAAVYGVIFVMLDGEDARHDSVAPGRAFQPRYALLFALSVTALLLLSAFLADQFGPEGATAGIVVAGFADAHSASASVARLLANGMLDERAAIVALSLAVFANSLTKVVVAWVSGGWRYARALAPGIALMLAAFLAGAMLEIT
jgi:uncharacterized membrane protein (DUF4010 family)